VFSQAELAAVLADLDDDAPRRVLADELEAKGDPRGELISVQCELARLGYASRPPTWDWVGDALIDPETVDQSVVRKLRARENALLAASSATWLSDVAKNEAVTFERGFPARVVFDARDDAAEQRFVALMDRAPTITEVEITTWPRLVAAFFGLPSWSRVRELRVGCRAVRALAASRTLGALRRLSLHGDQPVLDELVSWSGLRALTRLDLNPVPIGPDGLERLLGAIGSLSELQLRSGAIGPEGAERLAAEPKLTGLTVLSLLNNKLGPAGTVSIASAGFTVGLRALDVRKNKIGVKGVATLAAGLPELRTLDLTGNTLGEDGLAALTEGDGLGKLRELCLQQTALDDAAIVRLARSPFLSRVRVLSLRSNKIGDAGAKALAETPYGAGLLQLNLNNNAVGASGKKALDASKALSRCRVICK
jgi:uncharacterized protein (TIGR02996 family)